MKILIYGGDVVGSIYAARLHGPKHEVTVLAQGGRLADLQQHGVILCHGITGDELFLHVRLIEELTSPDHYDVALVTVPPHKQPGLLPDLIGNKRIGTVLVMGDHFGAFESWYDIPKNRVLFGCPGFAGIMNGRKVDYLPTPLLLQRATIGTLDHESVPHLRTAMHMFRQAGLYVSTCGRMDALLKTQTAVFVSLAAGVLASHNSGVRAGYDFATANLVIRSVRECFAVLAQLRVPVTPRYLKWLSSVSSKCLTDRLLQWSRTTEFDLTVAAQLKAAGDELAYLADQLGLFSMLASVKAPAFDELTGYLTAERGADLFVSTHVGAS